MVTKIAEHVWDWSQNLPDEDDNGWHKNGGFTAAWGEDDFIGFDLEHLEDREGEEVYIDFYVGKYKYYLNVFITSSLGEFHVLDGFHDNKLSGRLPTKWNLRHEENRGSGSEAFLKEQFGLDLFTTTDLSSAKEFTDVFDKIVNTINHDVISKSLQKG